jgi:Flp pilus assembly CpaF family ATPase
MKTEKEKRDLNIGRVIEAAQALVDGLVREGDVGRVRYTVPRRLVDRLTSTLRRVAVR